MSSLGTSSRADDCSCPSKDSEGLAEAEVLGFKDGKNDGSLDDDGLSLGFSEVDTY